MTGSVSQAPVFTCGCSSSHSHTQDARDSQSFHAGEATRVRLMRLSEPAGSEKSPYLQKAECFHWRHADIAHSVLTGETRTARNARLQEGIESSRRIGVLSPEDFAMWHYVNQIVREIIELPAFSQAQEEEDKSQLHMDKISQFTEMASSVLGEPTMATVDEVQERNRQVQEQSDALQAEFTRMQRLNQEMQAFIDQTRAARGGSDMSMARNLKG